MERLRRLALAALIAGLGAGVAATLIQSVGAGPLIARAETFEAAAAQGADAPLPPAHDAAGHDAAPVHDHAGHDAAVAQDHAGHDHGSGWAPADGAERAGYTLAANLLLGVGYGLALTGLMTLAGSRAGWRRGLLWGIGGFAATMLAPAVGLPPELPGAPAADLAARQAWWVATVLATGAGLALLAFRRDPAAWALAAALILAPQIVGAPTPPAGLEAAAPHDLAARFALVALAGGLAFWTLLGALGGAALARLDPAR